MFILLLILNLLLFRPEIVLHQHYLYGFIWKLEAEILIIIGGIIK